ncbi:MAG TPA: MltA domain-containing protein [Candidatus Binatia bacterium]
MTAERRRAARAARSLAATLLLAAGCSTHQAELAHRTAVLVHDDLDAASLALAAGRAADAIVAGGATGGGLSLAHRRVTSAELAATARFVAAAASGGDIERAASEIASHCELVAAAAPARITAYYEPVLAARMRPDRRFRYPIYRAPTPEQLARITKKLGHLPDRADIDRRGALAGLHLELAWTDDPVARFFLQVQGSGVLDDGSRRRRVGFAGTNGLAWRSIGAVMRERGLLAPGNLDAGSIRRWLREHPSGRDRVLEADPRYVFFAVRDGEGPVGSSGAGLVAGRSVAADPAVPPGTLAWLSSTWPVAGATGTRTGSTSLARFVFVADTGAAIRGEARLDVFAGSGEEAGAVAGLADEKGELFYVLCPSGK